MSYFKPITSSSVLSILLLSNQAFSELKFSHHNTEWMVTTSLTITPDRIKSAFIAKDETGQEMINISLEEKAARQLEKFSGSMLFEKISVYADDTLISTATVHSVLTRDFRISIPKKLDAEEILLKIKGPVAKKSVVP